MRSRTPTALIVMALSCTGLAGPDLTKESYDTVRIVSPQSKELAKSSDRDAIGFLLASMKRASSAGSNTYGLSLTSIIEFSSPASRQPSGNRAPRLREATRWYVDLSSGHFALAEPPKLVMYRFAKDDLAMLKKKLKIISEAAPSNGDKPAK